jgi:hypothetical protein
MSGFLLQRCQKWIKRSIYAKNEVFSIQRTATSLPQNFYQSSIAFSAQKKGFQSNKAMKPFKYQRKQLSLQLLQAL